MLNLKDVTLASFTREPEITSFAMHRCLDVANFADAVLLSSEPFHSHRFRTEKILVPPGMPDCLGRAWYRDFSLRRLADYITTPFTLVIQWDSWIINANAWTDEFLQYDYIGARWPWLQENLCVGNGGFCLRSRALNRAAKLIVNNYEKSPGPTDIADDVFIGQTWRPLLESKFKCKFAPGALADKFSNEYAICGATPFGFHDARNFHKWMYPPTILPLIPLMADYFVRSSVFDQMIGLYRAGAERNEPGYAEVYDALLTRRILTG